MSTTATPPGPPAGLVSAITVKDSDAPAAFNAVFVDALGNVVAPDDIPVWASNDPTVCDIASTSADGESGLLKYGVPGSVTIVGTSHDTDGTVITATGTVIVTAGEAAAGFMNFTVPTDAPPVVAPTDPTLPSTSDSPPVDTTTPAVAGATS